MTRKNSKCNNQLFCNKECRKEYIKNKPIIKTPFEWGKKKPI